VSMSESDLNIIVGALREAKEEHSRQLRDLFGAIDGAATRITRLEGKIDSLQAHGCLRGQAHAARLDTHEVTLSEIRGERRQLAAIGAGTGGGIVGVVWAIIEIAQRVFGAGGPTAGG
jgi:hypothetical protein